MNDQTDSQLLRVYTENHSEAAFTELVRRHVDFVYSAARRIVCDPHLAEDVTQGVFIAFAKNARQLTDRPVLSGWLHRTAQNIAAQAVRTIERRRAREQEAVAMNELLAHEPDAVWENIAPHLDTALGELSEPDRDALLLRYFERKSAREMAQTLGTSEEAAQKRVNRAVERLREFFLKRNVTIGSNGLVVLISANAVQAAPDGLVVTISSVFLAGTAVQTSAVIGATKTIAMTTLQKTLITGALTIAIAIGVFEARRISTLQRQVAILEREKLQAAEHVQQLQSIVENISVPANASNVQIDELEERLKKSQSEVLQLRSRVAHSIADRTDVDQMRAELDRLSNGPPAGVLEKNGTLNLFSPSTNEWARSVNKQMFDQAKSRELEKLAQLRRKLDLSPEQESAIQALVLRVIENKTKPKTASSLEDLASLGNDDKKLEEQIRHMLLPQQISDYDVFLEGQLSSQARFEANREVMNLQSILGLSPEQQSKVFDIIFQQKMKADSIVNTTLGRQEFLNRKLKPLEGVLTANEIEIYRQQLESIYVGNK